MKIPVKLPSGEKKMLYFDGYTHTLLQFFKKAVHNHNTSVVLLFDGRSGMGKTTLSNQVGIFLDPNFGLHKMFYTPETFLEGLKNAKKGDYICFDEAMILSNRAAISRVNKMIIIAMSMIRSKQIFVGFCINSLFDLDKNIAIFRSEVLFHVYGDTLIDRGRYAAFFKGKDTENKLKKLYLLGKKYYDYSKPHANYVGSFTKEFVVDEKEYEKQKQVGVNTFLSGIETSSSKKYSTMITDTIERLMSKGFSQSEAGWFCGIAQQNVSKRLATRRKTHLTPT